MTHRRARGTYKCQPSSPLSAHTPNTSFLSPLKRVFAAPSLTQHYFSDLTVLSASNRFSILLGISFHNGFQLDEFSGGPAGIITASTKTLSVNCDYRVTAETAAAHPD